MGRKGLLFAAALAGAWAIAGPGMAAHADGARARLFVLDASGSMGLGFAPSYGARLDVGKEEIRKSAAQAESQGASLGLMAFSHRTGQCDDIEMMVEPRSPRNRAQILSALDRIHPNGNTPLAQAIAKASEYLESNRIQGAEIIIVSDGMDNCGGDPTRAALEARNSTGASVSVIGIDMSLSEARQLQELANVGKGTFQPRNTPQSCGGGPPLSMAPPAASGPPPGAPALLGPFSWPQGLDPSVYLPGKIPVQPPSVPQSALSEQDDPSPIIHPGPIPREISFDPVMKPKAPAPKPAEKPPQTLAAPKTLL